MTISIRIENVLLQENNRPRDIFWSKEENVDKIMIITIRRISLKKINDYEYESSLSILDLTLLVVTFMFVTDIDTE